MSRRANERRAEAYRKVKSAEAEVLRRLTLALGRLQVNVQSDDGGIPAQFLHAVHYIQRGYADDSRIVPPESPDVHFAQDESERLAVQLQHMIVVARNARSTFGEAE